MFDKLLSVSLNSVIYFVISSDTCESVDRSSDCSNRFMELENDFIILVGKDAARQ